jgi:16S rRNA (guanine1207-N2)-methyltransferase
MEADTDGLGVTRWLVNVDARVAGDGDGVVVLTAGQMTRPPDERRPVVCLHDALQEPLAPAAEEVVVVVPEYRGRTVLALLAWLVRARLAGPRCRVLWRLRKQQGPASVARMLAGDGWQLTRSRAGGAIVLGGTAPSAEPDAAPQPASFTTTLGATALTFAADYGVFSPRHVDEGTRLLFDCALRRFQGLPALADVGVGYGALAIGLVRNGVAPRAVATDVDCLALLLAQRNAQAADVPLETWCSADPGVLPPTGLTVCNVPTHIDIHASRMLLGALAARTADGWLQCVVHTTLEQRYARSFTELGLSVERDLGDHHIVLTVSNPRALSARSSVTGVSARPRPPAPSSSSPTGTAAAR